MTREASQQCSQLLRHGGRRRIPARGLAIPGKRISQLAVIFQCLYPSDALNFAISVIGVIVFSGFTAYDTQMIKQAYSDQLNPEDRMRLAVSGALDLYLDFINLFRFLLTLFGERE